MMQTLQNSAEAVSDALTSTAWIEILVAFAVYFVLSFLWWGPLFGKPWARQMGMDPAEKPEPKAMGRAMALQAAATFLIAFVFWHVEMAFNVVAGDGGLVVDALPMGLALQGAFWTWLGFFLPVQLGKMAWERGTWSLATINAGGHLVGLLAMAATFALL